MTTTFTNKLTELINYLDERVGELGGYSFTVTHYDFALGDYRIVAQPFPDTVERAQDVADALDLTFEQDGNPRFPRHYTAVRDGVEYNFTIVRKPPEGYPARFTPAAVTS